MAPNFHSFSKCQRAVVLFVLLAAGSVRFASAAVIPVGSGCTLAQAITAANTDSACGGATGNGADTLVLSGDVSLLSVDNLTDGPNGLPSITSEILIEGGGAVIERSSTLACPQTPTFRLFHVASTGDLTLRDVILRSGCLDESSIVAGGGIYVDGGDLSVVGSTLQGNAIRYVGVSAGSSGGAIYNLGGNVSLADSWVMDSFADGDQAIGGAIYNGGGGHLQVEDSTLLNNLVGWSSGSGGAIYNLASDLTLIRADFVENEAHGATGRGGALYNDAEGTVRVDSSLFFRNLARGAVGRGGAIYHGSGTLTSRWSSFSRNQAGGAGGEGGGVWNGSGILVVEDSLFLSNIGGGAGGVGGGVFNLEGVVQIARSKLKFNSSAGAVGRGGAILSQGGDLEISDTELLGNRAEGNGGALYLRGTASCRILHSLCQANIAQGTPGTSRGGGIYLEAGRLFAANTTFSLNEWATGAAIFNEGGEAELVHCTLFNEPATSSLTAIFNESTLRLSNSLVLTTASDLNCANTGTFVDGGGNLVSDGSCPGIPSAVITGFDTALANHGGQTATHALLAGSNAIDAALLTGCGFAGAGSVDQRGAQRGVDGDGAPGSPQVGDCDVGAYEFGAAAPPWRIFSDDFESGDTGSWSDQSSP